MIFMKKTPTMILIKTLSWYFHSLSKCRIIHFGYLPGDLRLFSGPFIVACFTNETEFLVVISLLNIQWMKWKKILSKYFRFFKQINELEWRKPWMNVMKNLCFDVIWFLVRSFNDFQEFLFKKIVNFQWNLKTVFIFFSFSISLQENFDIFTWK